MPFFILNFSKYSYFTSTIQIPHHDNDATGWFNLNDGSVCHGLSPRRFFVSVLEILHTSSMSPYEDPAKLVFFA